MKVNLKQKRMKIKRTPPTNKRKSTHKINNSPKSAPSPALFAKVFLSSFIFFTFLFFLILKFNNKTEELKGFFIELLKEDEEFRKDVKDVLISLLLPPRPHPLHPSSSADHPADQSEEKSM